MEPRCRLGVTYVPEQERAVFERVHFLHSRDLWNRDDRLVLAVQIETPDLRRTAEQISYVKRVSARDDVLDHCFPTRNDLGRVLQFRHVERHTQDFAMRRVCAGKEVERGIATQARHFYLVAELSDLLPGSIWPQQVMREVPPITVCDRRKNVFAVTRTFERDLCDPWKVFAD